MTGTTVPDGLPFPDDFEDAADSPTAFEALAQATQTALTNRDTAHAPAGHGHASVPYADTSGNANALGGVGPGGYSGAGHGHNPSAAGIRSGSFSIPSIPATGILYSPGIARNANERHFCTVTYSDGPATSTFLIAVVTDVTVSEFKVAVRNSGTGTITNVIVNWLAVRDT